LVTNAAGPSNPKKRKAQGPAVKIEIDMDDEMDDEERQLEVTILRICPLTVRLSLLTQARLAAVRAKKRKTSNVIRVKAEVKPRLPPSFIPGEVIDLTED
jgi:hypothetical protein